MKLKPLFFFVPFLTVSIVAFSAYAGAVELKSGLSVSGTWYNLYSGQIDYNGPSSTLTIIELNGDVARVSYSWGKAPLWNINKSGSFELVVSVARKENNKKIEFKSPRSGSKFSFVFDPIDPLVKGKCRTLGGRVVSIEMK
jgi:hypothetical protein